MGEMTEAAEVVEVRRKPQRMNADSNKWTEKMLLLYVRIVHALHIC